MQTLNECYLECHNCNEKYTDYEEMNDLWTVDNKTFYCQECFMLFHTSDNTWEGFHPTQPGELPQSALDQIVYDIVLKFMPNSEAKRVIAVAYQLSMSS